MKVSIVLHVSSDMAYQAFNDVQIRMTTCLNDYRAVLETSSSRSEVLRGHRPIDSILGQVAYSRPVQLSQSSHPSGVDKLVPASAVDQSLCGWLHGRRSASLKMVLARLTRRQPPLHAILQLQCLAALQQQCLSTPVYIYIC
jgi:hypothetical protein